MLVPFQSFLAASDLLPNFKYNISNGLLGQKVINGLPLTQSCVFFKTCESKPLAHWAQKKGFETTSVTNGCMDRQPKPRQSFGCPSYFKKKIFQIFFLENFASASGWTSILLRRQFEYLSVGDNYSNLKQF